MNEFSVLLGITYYNGGFFNVNVIASQILGEHGQNLKLIFRNQGEIIVKINRTANKNHSVRLYGGKILREFIQRNYQLFDLMKCKIINPNEIQIL